MSVVTVFVTSDGSSSERRFDKSLTLSALKVRLEPITGVPAAVQQLSLYSGDKLVAAIESESEDSTQLGAFPVENFARIHVSHTGRGPRDDEFSDLSGVEKYELPDDEYDKRTDSVRAFKIRNKIGRFAESNSADPQKHAYADPPVGMSVGSRFEAEIDKLKRRGVVRKDAFQARLLGRSRVRRAARKAQRDGGWRGILPMSPKPWRVFAARQNSGRRLP